MAGRGERSRWFRAHGALRRLDADGGYRLASSQSLPESDPTDSGTFVIEGGTWHIVSDDTTSICQPGDEGVWLLHAMTPDAFELVEVDEMCLADGGRGQAPGTRLLATRTVY